MTWELCDGSSQNLVDMWGGCDESTSWQKAKQHFIDKGYEGKYILMATNYGHSPFEPYRWFKGPYHVNLK